MKGKIGKYELIPIKSLKPYAKNSRTHSTQQIKQLVNSIKEYGFTNPILVDENNVLIAGHARLEAASKLKFSEIPCIILDGLTAQQKSALVIADNKLALNAGWNDEILKAQLSFLSDNAFDLSLTGFSQLELDEIFPPKKETFCDEDDVPEVKEPVCKLGEVWILGDHRLMCGDSTNSSQVQNLMNGHKADMVFTDPPYNQETEGGFKGDIGKSLSKQSKEIEHLCDFDPKSFLQILCSVFVKNKMNSYCFCNKDLIVDYLNWARENKYSYNILIWKKPNAIPLGGSYRPDIEYLLVFRKSGIFNGALDAINYSKILDFPRVKNKIHPTMKPIELIENQLRIASNNNSLVLDLFGGSGSTLIACEKTNRKCYMMELDPHYCDVIIKRWEQYTGKKAIKEI